MDDWRAGSAVVIGGGTMGAGIAQVLLGALVDGTVTLVERSADELQAAVERLRRGLERSHRRAPDSTEAVEDVLSRLQTRVDFDPACPAQVVIEAVPESMDLKADVLGRCVASWPDALIATNTSSLSVSELARALPGGTRFLGMHFFNPVPVSQLVEIVVPSPCDQATVGAAKSWCRLIRREPIVVRDSPGFATSRLGVAIGLEAMRMLEEGVASVADIDRAMVLGYRFPLGPLELTDRVGLDVRLAIAQHLSAELGPRFDPPRILLDMVSGGDLGQKSGRGFYTWDEGRRS